MMTASTSAQRKPRHCMVVHAYYPIGETRVQREALALIDCGYEVDVLCLRSQGELVRETHDGVSVHRLPVRRHRSRGFVVQLSEYVAFFVLVAAVLSLRHLRRPYDAVQVHNLPDFLVFSALVPKMTGAVCILDLHDLMPEFFASRIDAAMKHPLVQIIVMQERLACRFADHVITVTDTWRDRLIGRGIPASKITVVMNLADERIFRRPAVGSSDQRTRTELRLMYHGTFAHHYGVDLILDAVAQLRHEIPHLRVVLLGAGDARDELLARRTRLGLEDRVTISPAMVDAADLPDQIAAADVGVVPTRSGVFTDDLLPTKLIEFVAMGTPVIAARTPTVETYFDEDMVQFFAPDDPNALADAIREVADDRDRRRALVDNADAFNRKYEWPTMASAYVHLVDTLISGASHGEVAAGERTDPASSASRTSVRAAPESKAHYDSHSSTAEDDPKWDAFLASVPGGNHTQTSAWAQVKALLGWRAVRVVVEQRDVIVGGAQILYRPISAVGAVGYVSRGPVLAADHDGIGDRILDEIEGISRELNIRHLTLQPPGTGDATPLYFEGRSYLPSSAQVAPRATVLLDVTPDPDEILAAMSSKTRYNVRLSGRRSVAVREGDVTDIAPYHQILLATGARQGFSPRPRSYFERMWDVLAPRGHLRLSFAEVDGAPVSAQLAVAFGDTVVNKLSVWSGAEGRHRPNEALQWATIQWAHSNGYQRYDLEGLDLKAAYAVLRGEPLPESTGQSVTSYKLGFGGDVVVMPSAHMWIPNPLARWTFGHAYPYVSNVQWFKKFLRRLQTAAAHG